MLQEFEVREDPGCLPRIFLLRLPLGATGVGSSTTAATKSPTCAAAEADKVVCVLQGPGVQQQAGTREHVARVGLGIASLQDVPILLTDLSPGVELGGRRSDGLNCTPGGTGRIQAGESVEGGVEAGGYDVKTRIRVDPGQLDDQVATLHLGTRHVQGSSPQLQRATGADRPASLPLARGHTHLDVVTCFFKEKVVVPGGKLRERDEPILQAHEPTAVGHGRSTPELEEGHLVAAQTLHVSPVWDAKDVTLLTLHPVRDRLPFGRERPVAKAARKA